MGPGPPAGAARTGWSPTRRSVQCPELCGRMASSLTGSPAGRRARAPRTISTARTPVTSSRRRSVRGRAGPRRQSGCRPGAGATTSVQIPSGLHRLHDRHTAACPIGLRGPRRNRASARGTNRPGPRPAMPRPLDAARASQSAASPRSATTATPLPSYPPVGSSTPAAADPPPELGQVRADRTQRPGGPGITALRSTGSHRGLVLGEHECRRTGRRTTQHPPARRAPAAAHARGRRSPRHSRQRTTAAPRGRRPPRPEHPARPGRRCVGRLGEHPQPHARATAGGASIRASWPPPTTPTRETSRSGSPTDAS